MNASNVKGTTLERAVRAIEETIIRNTPSLKKAEFEIEGRKVITVLGVRHEIDLWVKIQKGTHFEALHIFEAKNWSSPVGKSEILDFSEKIRVTGAAKGYFVAKEFTSAARAQAVQDRHMQLVEVTENFVSALDNLQLVSSAHRIEKLSIRVKDRNAACVENPPLLDHRMGCVFQGMPMTVSMFCIREAEKRVREARKNEAVRFGLIGTHFGRQCYQIVFDSQELLVGDIDVEYVVFDVDYSVVTSAAHVFSKFEVEGRGRVYTFQAQSLANPDVTIEVDFVQVIPTK